MAQIAIEGEIAERLQRVAQSQGKSIEQMLESLLNTIDYQPSAAEIAEAEAALNRLEGMFDGNITHMSTSVREMRRQRYQNEPINSD